MMKFIDGCRKNFIDNVTDLGTLKKEIIQLMVVWVELYWFMGPELQLIILPILGRIIGIEFNSFYIATLCHGVAFVFGWQITLKVIILCILYVIGWHLKKTAQ